MSAIKSQDINKLHYLSFDEEKHRYTLDGNHIPGATTFCKGGFPTSEALIAWMKSQSASYALDIGFQLGLIGEPLSEVRKKEIIKEAKTKDKEAAEAAAELGTLLHDYAFHSELNHVDEVREILAVAGDHPEWQKIKNEIDKFEAWKKKNEDEMVASESIVASVLYSYGGKFDRLARRNGVLILSDFKSSNAIYLDHFLQLAAYAVAIQEWTGLRVEGLEVLRFGKENGEFETKMIDKPEEIQAFKDQAIICRQTYKFRLKWEADPRFSWKKGKKS